MRTTLFQLVLAGAVLAPAHAAQLYVSGAGNDGFNGGSPSSAFRSLAKAAQVVNPGDTVHIMNGSYASFTMSRSGNGETGRITWKAYPGHTPELVATSWNAITVKASWQTIDGLTLTGNNDNVSLPQAEADYAAAGAGSWLFNGNAIYLDNRDLATKHHHLTVRNCTVRKFGGGGLVAMETDYIVFENNKVYENAWYSRYGNSGITLFTHDMGTSGGYRNYIVGNKMWNNRGLVKWKAKGDYSDGNGFILDISSPTYTGRTLVSDNVAFNNGGSGLHAFRARRADFVNNTAYMNGQKVNYAEIYANESVDIKFYNNIAYARTGGKVNDNKLNTNVVYNYNVYYNGVAAVVGANDRNNTNPNFANPGVDPNTADFRLLGNSPAIDSGVSIAGVTSVKDHAGVARPVGAGIDRGAHEYNLKPRIVSAASASGKVNTSFRFDLVVYNYPKTFAASGLPAGLSINTTTGVISGVPTQAGTRDVTVTATNSVGSTSGVLRVTIAP